MQPSPILAAHPPGGQRRDGVGGIVALLCCGFLLAGCETQRKPAPPPVDRGGLPSKARNKAGGNQAVPVTYTHPGDRLCYEALRVEEVSIVPLNGRSEVTLTLKNVTAKPLDFMFYTRYFGDSPNTEFKPKGTGKWRLKHAGAGETVTLHSSVSNPGVRGVALSVLPYRARTPAPRRESTPGKGE